MATVGKTEHTIDEATKKVAHFTVAERAARGKAARDDAPLDTRGLGAACRPPDPVDLLEEQAKTRVPELVPIRYGRMLVSPFTFYRGAALPDGVRPLAPAATKLHTQLCGDAHLSNFGAYAAPDRRSSSASTTSTRRFPGRSNGM